MADLKDTKKTLDETSESVKKLRDNIGELGRTKVIEQLGNSISGVVKSIEKYADIAKKINSEGLNDESYKRAALTIGNLNNAIIQLRDNKEIISTEGIKSASDNINMVIKNVNKLNDALNRVINSNSTNILNTDYFGKIKEQINGVTESIENIYKTQANTLIDQGNISYVKELNKSFSELLDKAKNLNIDTSKFEAAGKQIQQSLSEAMYKGTAEQINKLIEQQNNVNKQIQNKITGKESAVNIGIERKQNQIADIEALRNSIELQKKIEEDQINQSKRQQEELIRQQKEATQSRYEQYNKDKAVIAQLREELNILKNKYKEVNSEASKFGIDTSKSDASLRKLENEINKSFSGVKIAEAQEQIKKYGEEITKLESTVQGKQKAIDLSTSTKKSLDDLKQQYYYKSKEYDEIIKDANAYNVNLKTTQTRIAELDNSIKSAFNSRNVADATEAINKYTSAVKYAKDQVGYVKNRQKELLDETRKYIRDQEILGNKKISYSDQEKYYSGQLTKAIPNTREYIEILNLQQKAAEAAAKNAEKFDAVRRYVRDQEILTGKSMPYTDQIAFYNSQLSNFVKGSREYIEVLALIREAEKKSKESTKSKVNTDQQDLLNSIKNYVKDQEILTGKKMPYTDQMKYYSDQLKQFEKDSRGYIEVLGLLRNAENKYNEQLNSKKSQQDLLRQNKNNILSQITGGLSERDSIIKGLDTTGLDKVTEKIRIIRKELDKALMSGDAGRAASLWDAYVNATDKVIGRSNAVAEAQKRQAESQKELLNEVKSYVSTQEILNNQKMPAQQQADYYSSQLGKFAPGTREYIEVLRLKQNAERQAADEAVKSAEREKQAQIDAANAVKQRVTSTINTVRQVAQAVNNAVNNIIKAIRTVISVITKITSVVATVVKTVISGIQKILTLLGNLGDRIKSLFTGIDKGEQVNNVFGSIGLSATELRSKLLLLKGAFDALFNNELIQKAKDLLGSIYSMRTIVGTNLTQETIDWANNMEKAFGLNATSLISDLKEINAVLYGLGMSAEDTAVGGKNLLMMSRYMASIGLAGGDANQVMSKIVSGMKGMTASVDDLGLSVRDSQMNTFLKDLKAQGGEFAKLKTDFSSLNEQARVYVRYAALIQQFTSKYDITNLVNGMNTVTGRLGIIKDYWNELLTQMGTGLAVVVSKLSAVIIKIIQTLQSWVQGFFSLFGIDVKLGLDLNNQVGGVSDASKAVSDMNDGLEKTEENLDNVASSANKAKGSLQSFDRINNVTSSSSSSGTSTSTSGMDDFDYSSLMTNMLEELDKMADEAAQSFADKIWEEFKAGAKKAYDDFIEYAKKKTGRQDFDLGFDFDKIGQNLKDIKKYIEGTIQNWGNFFIEIGLKIMDDINIGQIITDITTLAASFSKLAYVVSDVLTVALMNFYDIGLSPIVKYIGEVVSGAINKVTEQFDKWSNWFAANAPLINNFFITLGEVVAEAFNIVKPYIEGLIDSIGNIFDNMNESARNKLVEFMQGFIENKDETIAYLGEAIPNAIERVKEAFSILRSIVEPIGSILGELVKSLGGFLTNEGIPWLIGKLKELGDWLNKHKDDIVELVKILANTAWESFKVFVDLVGKLVTFAVEHPGVVVAMFAGLTAIKAASWFTDTAGGIAGLIVQLQALKAFGSISALTSGAAGAAGAAGSGAAGAAAGLSGIAAAAGPIAIVAAALAAIGIVLVDLWNTSEGFRQSVTKAWETIQKSISDAIERIKDAFGNLKESLSGLYDVYESSGLKDIVAVLASIVAQGAGNTFAATIDLITGLLVGLINIISDVITVVKGVADVVDGTIKIIVGALTGNTTLIQSGFEAIGDGIISVVDGLLTGLTDLIGTSIQSFIDIGSALLGGIGQGISEGWSSFIEFIRTSIDEFINKVREFFGIHSPSTVFAEIGKMLIEGMIQGISNAWNSLISKIAELCSNVISKVKEGLSTLGTTISGIFDDAKSLALGAWGNIKSEFTSIASKAADGLATIKSKAKQIFEDVKTSANNILGDLWDNALSLARDPIGTVKNAVSSGYNTLTGKAKAVSAAPITTHANGGSIAGGQLFIANEGGGAELIGNIDGTRKTNVANNQMITDAIYEAVYNALADVHDQSVKSTPAGNKEATININGFGIIDRATLSELARLLAPYLGANSLNVANNNFSI